MKNSIYLLLIVLIVSCQNQIEQKEEVDEIEDNRAKILFLSVYHFNNPGADTYNLEIDDYLNEKRQAEIEEVNKRLSVFQPTKIFVEFKKGSQSRIDSLYNAYNNDQLIIDSLKSARNEIYQLGFKLGKANDVNRILGIDEGGAWLGEYVDFIADTFQVAPYAEYRNSMMGFMEEMNEKMSEQTVLENLIYMNEWDNILKNHYYYNNIAVLVKDSVGIMFKNHAIDKEIDSLPYTLMTYDFENIGAELVSEWYKRNLLIYRNILDRAEENDRIIVIFGQGHARYIMQMIDDNPDLQLVNSLEYLDSNP